MAWVRRSSATSIAWAAAPRARRGTRRIRRAAARRRISSRPAATDICTASRRTERERRVCRPALAVQRRTRLSHVKGHHESIGALRRRWLGRPVCGACVARVGAAAGGQGRSDRLRPSPSRRHQRGRSQEVLGGYARWSGGHDRHAEPGDHQVPERAAVHERRGCRREEAREAR